MKRTIIAAIALAVLPAGPVKADSCQPTIATLDKTVARLNAEATEIFERRERALDTFIRSVAGGDQLTWKQLRVRYGLTALVMKEIDDAFAAYAKNSLARAEAWRCVYVVYGL